MKGLIKKHRVFKIAILIFVIINGIFSNAIAQIKVRQIDEVVNKAVELELFSGCILVAI